MRASPSKDASAEHQPDNADYDHEQVEVAAGRALAHHADAGADQGEWDDQPVEPTEQRNEGDDRDSSATTPMIMETTLNMRSKPLGIE